MPPRTGIVTVVPFGADMLVLGSGTLMLVSTGSAAPETSTGARGVTTTPSASESNVDASLYSSACLHSCTQTKHGVVPRYTSPGLYELRNTH
eukprot:m.1308808 g.1308808  ORF g.1308808 m.1308808 type:complete len:92 (-) comp24822_c0_seq2:88-363(-)